MNHLLNVQRVLARATLPRCDLTAHQELHVFHVLDGIDHLLSLVDALVVEIVEQRIDVGPILRCEIGAVLVQMLEMRLLGHRSLIDVVVGGDTLS